MIQFSVRSSVPWLYLAFAASSLAVVFPGSFSRWLLHNRSYIGLCFAAAMAWQLLFILWMVMGYWGYYAREVYVLEDVVVQVPGYLFLFAMTLTSFPRWRSKLSARQWRMLHKSGIYFLWATVWTTYWYELYLLRRPPVYRLRLLLRWSSGLGVSRRGVEQETLGAGGGLESTVRIPAALNGIAGLRPTVGRYPNLGIMPISHTRDTAGPMARTVDDLVLLDGIISEGPTSLEPASLEGVRLGLPKPFVDDLDAETQAVFEEVVKKLTEAGAVLVPLDLGNVSELNAKAGGAIALWETKRDLGAYLAAHGSELTVEQLAAEIASPDVKAFFHNVVLGKDAISDDAYAAAIGELRPRLQLAYLAAFRNHRLTAILFPTTPLPAQPIQGSDEEVTLNGEKVPTFATFIRNSDPGSVAGLPGLTIPADLTASGLPVGVELDGLPFTDRALLSIGLALEQLLGPLPRPGS